MIINTSSGTKSASSNLNTNSIREQKLKFGSKKVLPETPNPADKHILNPNRKSVRRNWRCIDNWLNRFYNKSINFSFVSIKTK
jgi:phage-related protein